MTPETRVAVRKLLNELETEVSGIYWEYGMALIEIYDPVVSGGSN